MTDRLPTRVVFEVTGRGPFPFDMLRHDCCWPASGLDVKVMTSRTFEPTCVGTVVREMESRRSVTLQLADYGWGDLSGPTAARWASFGWTCEIIAAYCGADDVTERVRDAFRDACI